MKKNALFLLFILLFVPNARSTERNLLANSLTKSQLSEILDKGTGWVSLPAYQDRSKWASLPENVKSEIIANGEASLKYNWDIVKASYYLEFIRSGNRNVMQSPENRRISNITNLALAELVEGKGRFIDALADGIWAMCEQSTWVHSAHLTAQETGAGLPNPDDTIIDLGSGGIGALMSWMHYYFAPQFDKISPFIADRIRREVRARVLTPYYTRTNLWWMGFGDGMVNNWNVWINYNVLQCIMLMEPDAQKRTDNVYKVMTSIDKFINYYKEDGACEEGPGYWSHAGGKMFENLELLNHITNGKVNIYNNELIQNIGKYIYRAYIGNGYFVNFADASSLSDINPGLVYRYGKTINDPMLQNLGLFYAGKKHLDETVPSGTFETIVLNLFDAKKMMVNNPTEPLSEGCWLPQTGFASGRENKQSKDGFFFAAKGGHNRESHNHNDVGTFVLYYNALPVLIDVGAVTYTRQTFSSERYNIWSMQSGYHNLPAINGIDQSFGSEFKAKDCQYKSNVKSVNFSLDISGAYPQEAEVEKWTRSYQLNRGKNFIVSDEYKLIKNKGGNSLHFMTACQVVEVAPGILQLKDKNFVLQLKYNTKQVTTHVETIALTDDRLKSAWGQDTLYRLVMDLKDTGLTGKNQIEIRAVKK